MDGVQDLFDPRQIALFDAIDELSSNVASDIEIPQLIVVGDQKVGKSSVLEAIARFRFPEPLHQVSNKTHTPEICRGQ
jgi:GTP-binding protein EngB required for normal cell division